MEVDGHIRFLLEALQFPDAQNFTLVSEEQNEGFRALVFGLEDKYVRRAPSIRSAILIRNQKFWNAALACAPADSFHARGESKIHFAGVLAMGNRVCKGTTPAML